MSRQSPWSAERKARHTALLHRIRPWDKAGPKTPEGRARCCGNASKGYGWPLIRECSKLNNQLKRLIKAREAA